MKAKHCPVCDWEIKDGGVAVEAGGRKIVACSKDCAKQAQADPAKFIRKGK